MAFSLEGPNALPTANLQRLEALAAASSAQYMSASPFPHIVLDNLFPNTLLDAIVDEFPAQDSGDWIEYDEAMERKRESKTPAALGPATRSLINELNGSAMLRFLERLTGIEGLIADPHLSGGGLHEIEPGGSLSVHADFNWLADLGLERRLNLLLYLNRDWEEGYGGALELWPPDMSSADANILPVFNRCVIFTTTSTSFHGHPAPLTAPPGRTRRSLALYYYTSPGYLTDTEGHSTLWQSRPQERDEVVRELERRRGSPLRRLVKGLVPPILLDLYRHKRPPE